MRVEKNATSQIRSHTVQGGPTVSPLPNNQTNRMYSKTCQ